MKALWGLLAWGVALNCLASEQEIQRALIQRDQQSAEFAAGVRGGDRAWLEALHARQRLEVTTQTLHPDPAVARQLEPYQRQKMADERALVLLLRSSRNQENPKSPYRSQGGRATGSIP